MCTHPGDGEAEEDLLRLSAHVAAWGNRMRAWKGERHGEPGQVIGLAETDIPDSKPGWCAQQCVGGGGLRRRLRQGLSREGARSTLDATAGRYHPRAGRMRDSPGGDPGRTRKAGTTPPFREDRRSSKEEYMSPVSVDADRGLLSRVEE